MTQLLHADGTVAPPRPNTYEVLHSLIEEYERVCYLNCSRPEYSVAYREAVQLRDRMM